MGGGQNFDDVSDRSDDIDGLSVVKLKAILMEDLNREPEQRLSPQIVKAIVKLIREIESPNAEEYVDVDAAFAKFKGLQTANTDVQQIEPVFDSGEEECRKK